MAFGQPMSPAIGANPLDGIATPQLPQGTLAPMAAAVAPKPKINWLGVLADALSGAAGQTPLYTQSVMRQKMLQQQQALEEQRYQNHRKDDLSDAETLYKFKLDNPEPTQPSEYERLLTLATTLPDDDPRKAFIVKKLQGNDDPIVTLTLPGNRVYSGPRSGLAAALGGIPGGQGGADDTPTVEDGYSYTPGPGGRANKANWKPSGGQTPQASGGFPRR